MKFMLKFLFVLLSIVALVLVMALFVDGTFHVERTINVNLSKDETFEYLRAIEHQKDFSVWHKRDPKMTLWHSGTSGEVGYKMGWNSSKKEIGQGYQELIGIEEGKRIDIALTLIKPDPMESTMFLETKEISKTKTKVTWGMDGEIAYPYNLMLLFVDLNEKVGIDFEHGLKNLKTILEQKTN